MNQDVKTRKYAIVDLEATSTGVDAQIIQVGIVVVQDGKILQTYETDVNPHEALTSHIKQLTGLTDQRLAKAPDFSQVAHEIFKLLEGTVFVAHNVTFDANLLAEHLFLEGFELRTPRVDTVELSQVFFPTLERYSLGAVTQELGIELRAAHTASADALATAHLFLAIQDKIRKLPRITLLKLLTYADHLLYETGQVLLEMVEETSLHLNSSYDRVLDIVVKKPGVYKKARHLSRDFTHNISLLDLEERPEQVQFAGFVEEALEDDYVHFIQAQTGIGKTYGYLLPILARRPESQLILATPTKILQDQIMAGEIQKIADVFHLDAHSLKGYGNYIKLDAFWASLEREDENRLVNRLKMQILVWLTETETGDLDELKQKHTYPTYFDDLRHDGKVSATSLFRDIDFWQRSYDRAQNSQVVVTNQSYLLTRLVDDQSFLEGKILVLDEAQKMPLNLENFSRKKLAIQSLMAEVQNDLDASPDLLTRRLLESLMFHLGQLASKKGQVLEHVSALRQGMKELPLLSLPLLQEILAPHFDDFWVSQENLAEKKIAYLQAARLDMIQFKKMLPSSTKLLAISATLTISQRVNLPQLLGFHEDELVFKHLSHKRLDNQAIYLMEDLPSIKDLSAIAYASLITQQILALQTLKKPLMVLFTANQTLLDVASLLEEKQVSYLAQHKHGTASQVKRRFERGESQLLLGSSAFWEGVDFANQDQMMILLTRLPFDNPKDKYVQKMNQYLRAIGRRPFEDYHLPMAMLRLKQAMGRSNRRQGQRTALVLLDNRVLTKSYGKPIRRFLEGLCQVEEVNQVSLSEGIRQFLNAQK